jgi:hypothetical protein
VKHNLNSLKDVPITILFKLIYNSNYVSEKNGMHNDFRNILTVNISEIVTSSS